ncbi:MAG: hypothetical protein EOP09_09110, partial [Proteobacteria bacterium]
VFQRIPESIEHHQALRRVLGVERMKKIGAWVLGQSSGVATNLSLGFLFGFVPLLGHGIGVNLEGKHVTISSATAVFAWTSLAELVRPQTWAPAMGGLLIVGIMNFLVSFFIALDVAARAQRLKRIWVWYFLTGRSRQVKISEPS